MLAFVLTSCSEIGTQCFPDPDFGTGAIPRSKTMTIAPEDGDPNTHWVNTGVRISTAHPATITVEGIISFAKTQYSPSNFNYVTICKQAKTQPSDQPPGKPLLVHNLCNNNPPGTQADDYKTKCDDKSNNLIELKAICETEDTICNTGSHLQSNSGNWIKIGSCDPNLICRRPNNGSGDYQICILNQDSQNPAADPNDPNFDPNKYLTCYSKATCNPQPARVVKLTPAELSKNHNDIIPDMQFQFSKDIGKLFAGDIVNITINSPASLAPATVEPGNIQKTSYYDDGYNVFVPDVSAATKLPQECAHEQITYYYSSKPQCILPKCTATSDPAPCFWNSCGYGLWIAFAKNGKCPEQKTDAVDFTYIPPEGPGSDSELGIPILIDGTNNGAQYHAATTRQFVVPVNGTKVCGWFDGYGSSKIGLGGYQANVTVQSLIAVNGRPSMGGGGISGIGGMLYKTVVDKDHPDIIITSGKLFDTPASINTPKINDPATIPQDSSRGSGLGLLFLKINRADSTAAAAVTGQYTVKIDYFEITGNSTPISSVIEDAANFIKTIIFGSADENKKGIMKDYFKSLSDPTKIGLNYMNYIRILLVLYIVIYALTMLTGYVQISAMDLLIMAIKIGVVLALISDSSWAFFHDYFFQLFMDGAHEIVRLTSLHPDASPNMFAFVDDTFRVIFTPTTWLKILSLIFTHPLAILIVILLIVGIGFFLFGIYSAFVAYLLCVLATAILIMLAPIFIPCCLFSFTSKLFDNWWKLLVRYSLEPVLLILGLQIIVQIFYVSIIQLLNFTACWKCVWPINLTFSPLYKLFADAQIAPFICVPFFGVHSVFAGEGGMAFSNSLHIPIASGIIAVIMAFAVKGYDTMVNQMIDSLLEERPGSKKAGVLQDPLTHQAPFHASAGKAGEAIKGYAGKKARLGIKSATGFDIKTKEEMKKENDFEEAYIKRKGLRMFGENPDKRYINDVLDGNTSKNIKGLIGEHGDLIKDLTGSNGEAKRDEAAIGLGKSLFSGLGNDEVVSKTFAAGLRKLNQYEGKLPYYAEQLQKVLQTPEAASHLNDLSSKNALAQQNAQMHVGNAMFKDNKVADSLLKNREARQQIIDTVLKLGRQELEK